MNKKTCAVFCQAQGSETNEEIIGVLTAISVVSKRMAQKLALLERITAQKGGGKKYVRAKQLSPNGD